MGKDYYIEIDGVLVPVTEEVYYAFKRPAWRERKQAKVRSEKELSVEAFAKSGYDIPADEPLIDEIVADKLLLDELLAALAELTDDERFLIDQFFYKEKSERQIADLSGVSQQAISKRKNKILSKLRELLDF